MVTSFSIYLNGTHLREGVTATLGHASVDFETIGRSKVRILLMKLHILMQGIMSILPGLFGEILSLQIRKYVLVLTLFLPIFLKSHNYAVNKKLHGIDEFMTVS